MERALSLEERLRQIWNSKNTVTVSVTGQDIQGWIHAVGTDYIEVVTSADDDDETTTEIIPVKNIITIATRV